MRTKTDVLEQYYGTRDYGEASEKQYHDLTNTLHPPIEQWIKLKLPYEAPSHPGIPSMDEIDAAMEDNKLSHSSALNDVCRVGNCVIKRSGNKIILQEAENLLFLEQHSQVRAPKLYSAFFRREDGADYSYMVTEYIEGYTLDEEKWLALDDESQQTICAKLAEQFKLLQATPSDGEEYYGRVYNQGWPPILSLLFLRNQGMSGPFRTYEDLISAMHTSAVLSTAMSCMAEDFTPKEVALLEQFKPILRGANGSKGVLTHMDTRFENMIVRPIMGKDGKLIKDWDVTLIDWELLSWLPEYMQFSALEMRIALTKDETEKYVQKVFDHFDETYPKERKFLWDCMRVINYNLL